MAITPKHMPMPAHLVNLKPPTQADAVAEWERPHFGYGGNEPRTLEEFATRRGRKHELDNPTDDLKTLWEATKTQGIENAMIRLQRQYDGALQEKERIEANNAAVFAAEKAELRAAYLSQPGTTEADFERALPALLDAKRMQATLAGDTERQRAMDKMRNSIAL